VKIRNGFISNSSSSSFIIAIPSKDIPLNEFCQLIFGDEKAFPNLCVSEYGDEYYNQPWTFDIEKIAKLIQSQLREISYEDMIYEYQCGYDEETYSIQSELWNKQLTLEERTVEYKKIGEKSKEIAKKNIDKFISDNPNSQFYCIEFSDNDGSLYSSLEHGPTFSKIPHLVISKH
jgi:hypothetical protein